MSFPYYRRIPVFVPYNAKIADIKETDTSLHTLTLANVGGTGAITGETRKVIAIVLYALRVSGSGSMIGYPNEGALGITLGPGYGYVFTLIVADGTQRIQYKQDTANDDFDLYCLGYIVEV